MNKPYISITYIFLILLSTLMLPACKKEKAAENQDEVTLPLNQNLKLTPEQWKEAGIQVTTLPMEKIKKTITLSGTLVAGPNQSITISSPLQGLVSQIMIKPGQEVQKGQILLVLEDKEFVQWQESYLRSKTAYQFAFKDYQRQKELSTKNATSDKMVEAAEEKMLQLQIEKKAWEEKLKLLKIEPASLTPENVKSSISIRASSSGMVTDVFINLGKYVAAGTEMIQMVSTSLPMVVVKAFEKDLYYLHPGMTMKVYSNEQPDKPWTARLDHIIHQIREGGYAEVYGSFTQSPTSLFPGNFINADIELSSVESQIAPESAVVNFDNKNYLFVEVQDKTYQMVEVMIGVKHEGMIGVVIPQKYADLPVVIKGSYTLLMTLQNVEE